MHIKLVAFKKFCLPNHQQVAGGGVLALAKAMVFTGPAGLAFIVFFALNTGFVGTRLGLCWVMLEERYPELREQVWY